MCVTSLLCGPRADLWSFYGFLCKPFSLDIKVYQGWAFQRSGSTDPPKENGRKFAPTAPIASKFHLGNTWQFHSLSCFKMPLHGERIKGRKSLQPFPSETIIWGSAWTPRYIVYFKCIWIMLWKLILLLVFNNSYFIWFEWKVFKCKSATKAQLQSFFGGILSEALKRKESSG